MNIIVCIKQVPDTNDVKINPKTGTLIREGVPSIVNPEDKHAIEAALQVKEKTGGKVTVISMGPPQAAEALREALAMGADEAILLSDRAFAGADSWATSYVLGMAIKKIGAFDIIFCGRQAIDGDTAQVGPQLAELLGIPQVTYVKRIQPEADGLVADRLFEDGVMTLKVAAPVLFTVIKELNTPRYPHMAGIVAAFRTKQITVWGSKDINAEPSCIGIEGSPTQVKRTFAPQPRGKVQVVVGETVQQKASQLLGVLNNVVRS